MFSRIGEGLVVQFSLDQAKQALDLAEGTDTAHLLRHGVEAIRSHGHYQQEYLKLIYDLLNKQFASAIDESIRLTSHPETSYSFDTKDRKHNLILAAATTSVIFMVPFVGNISYSLQPGWNQLDLPDETICYLASGSDTYFLYRCTNDLMV